MAQATKRKDQVEKRAAVELNFGDGAVWVNMPRLQDMLRQTDRWIRENFIGCKRARIGQETFFLLPDIHNFLRDRRCQSEDGDPGSIAGHETTSRSGFTDTEIAEDD